MVIIIDLMGEDETVVTDESEMIVEMPLSSPTIDEIVYRQPKLQIVPVTTQ